MLREKDSRLLRRDALRSSHQRLTAIISVRERAGLKSGAKARHEKIALFSLLNLQCFWRFHGSNKARRQKEAANDGNSDVATAS